MIRAAVIAGIVCAATSARADGPPQPVKVEVLEVVFGGKAKVHRTAIETNAGMQADAVAACYARTSADVGDAVALVEVDRKGNTRKVTASGSGDAAVDRCLGKAIKSATWPPSTRGGAIVLRLDVAADTEGELGHNPYKASTLGTKDEATVTVDVQRAVTPDELLATFSARAMPGMKRCYKTALKHGTRVSAAMTLRVTIEADGAVSAVDVALGGDAALETCVGKVIRRVKFPAPGEQVVFTPSLNQIPA